MIYRTAINRLLLILLIVVFTIGKSHIYSQSPDDTFSEGIEYYASGDFAAAIDTWEKLVSSGFSSHDLYYNIGNAMFKIGNIPGAILYYEKALLLRPFNEDISYNLEIARSYISDDFETIPELFLIRWYKMLSLLFHSNTWAIVSLLIFVLSLGLTLVYLMSLRIRLKKLSFVGGLLMLLISIFSLSLAYQNTTLSKRKQSAIVFAPAVTGKSSPDESGKDLFLIHEGTKVQIEDELGGWYEVRLSDGNIGWVPSETVTKV